MQTFSMLNRAIILQLLFGVIMMSSSNGVKVGDFQVPDGDRNHVPLDEWLLAKRDVMEWALKLKSNANCQAKTRGFEDEMNSCTEALVKMN